MPETFAGIDVGGPRKGLDVAVVEARHGAYTLIELERRLIASDVVVLLTPFRPLVVAVDSPRCAALHGCKSRPCEVLLRKRICGIRYTPDDASLKTSSYYAWIRNGFSLYDELDDASKAGTVGDVIECFPTASWTAIGGARAKGPEDWESRAKWTRRLLARELEGKRKLTRVPANHNQDERDAIVAAHTAWAWQAGRRPKGAYWPIVVP